MSSSSSLLLRRATADDLPAIARLAQLDGRRLPAGPFLLAELDGRLIAAASVHDGAAVADPFVASADAVALLRERIAQITAAQERRAPVLAMVRGLFPAPVRTSF